MKPILVGMAVHGLWGTTFDCIQSLLKTHSREVFDILIVDNASPDPAPGWITQEAKVLRNDENLFCARAWNQIWGEAKPGQLVVIVNNDIEVTKSFLPELHRAASQVRRSISTTYVLGLGKTIQTGPQSTGLRLVPPWEHELSGVVFSGWKETYEEVGGFDGEFKTPWFEDNDFWMTCHRSGVALLVAPTTVFHRGEVTSKSVNFDRTANLDYFKNKWAGFPGFPPRVWKERTGHNLMHGLIKTSVDFLIRNKVVQAPVLELGSLIDEDYQWDRYGSFRESFKPTEFIGMDLRAGRNVDKVGDICEAVINPLPHTILCLDMLEHCFEFDKYIHRMFSLLPEGGVLVVTTPFRIHLHGYPSDYWRFTPDAHQKILRKYFPHVVTGRVDNHGNLEYPLMVLSVAFKAADPELPTSTLSHLRDGIIGSPENQKARKLGWETINAADFRLNQGLF